MIPEVQENNSLLHLTYNFPGRVHTVKPHPLSAPNGSTVLLLGHEHGLRILWHGGRALRDQPQGRQWNGASHPGQSVEIDSDGEGDTSASQSHDLYLKSDEEEYDPSKPFERIIQFFDLPLGVAVLRIALPPLPIDSLQRNHGALPPLFSEKLVAAVICSDASILLVILPLAPPSLLRKRKAAANNKPLVADGKIGCYGEQITLVTGGNDYQAVPRCVCLTIVPSPLGEDSDLEMDEDGLEPTRNASRDRRRQRSRTRSQSRSLRGDEGWDLLVASASSEMSGLLLLHRIPLTADGKRLDTSTAHTVPWSIQHLPSPAASIQFNPSLPNDERNSVLLVAEAKGPVRILNCLPTDTAGQCTWLVTLLPGFQPSARGRASRKHVLDAQWVQGGKAILVLLADGEWGIWDLFDAQPTALSTTHAPQARTLGSFAKFAISGSINSNPVLSNASGRDIKNSDEGKAGRLAPMTPGTRRVRQENLFSGSVQQDKGPARGGISLISSQEAKSTDDTVLLWYNDSITIIPSLRTHWVNKVKGTGNLFGNGAKGEARTISNVSLRGERRNDVVLLPASHHSEKKHSSDPESVIVQGESRIVLVTPPLSEPPTTSKLSPNPPSDQRLLERGDLTLEGMDRVLASMGGANPPKNTSANGLLPWKRKVGFLNT
ncbi:MAG: hypothetical protein Q9209_002928 [Squamulea sp. 1 TL-2023]